MPLPFVVPSGTLPVSYAAAVALTERPLGAVPGQLPISTSQLPVIGGGS